MLGIAQNAPLVSAEGPNVEINIPFRVSWWICSDIDITDNSIIVTHARDYVDFTDQQDLGGMRKAGQACFLVELVPLPFE